MTSVRNDVVPATTLIAFSLWPSHGAETSILASAPLPHLRAWLKQAQRVAVHVDQNQVQAPLLAALSLPHERAWAQAMGYAGGHAVVDGGVPWAALAAAQQGLSAPDGSPTGWAFITWCNWQVSNGQVTLGDPAQLQIDEASDAALFRLMQPFFAEDGIALHPYLPGQWLACSPLFVDLPTAALDRVIGRNIDPWLIGCQEAADARSRAAQLLRRLQNEVQMLLYTHAINDTRRLHINSFWLHGTGAVPSEAPQAREAPTLINSLRASALQQDFAAWLQAWQALDAQVIAPLCRRVAAGTPQRLVLCGAHEFHVYDSLTPSWWQRLRAHWGAISLDSVLAVAPRKD